MSKTVLVTGAGSGIGRQSALSLNAAGFRVGLCGRRQDALEETASMADHSDQMSVFACDVTDPEAVTAMYQAVEQEFGRLDVMFNNAGTNVPATNFGDLTPSQWLKVINVNLNGAFFAAHGAYDLMRRQRPMGGRIINNGSISAYVPRPGSAPYTASKHAITGLTRSISLDGRPFDIVCGQIDIGNAASHMTARMSDGVPQADGSMKPEPTMDVTMVGDAVVNMAKLPLDVNVQFMTIMASKMPFIGRG